MRNFSKICISEKYVCFKNVFDFPNKFVKMELRDYNGFQGLTLTPLTTQAFRFICILVLGTETPARSHYSCHSGKV